MISIIHFHCFLNTAMLCNYAKRMKTNKHVPEKQRGTAVQDMEVIRYAMQCYFMPCCTVRHCAVHFFKQQRQRTWKTSYTFQPHRIAQTVSDGWLKSSDSEMSMPLILPRTDSPHASLTLCIAVSFIAFRSVGQLVP